MSLMLGRPRPGAAAIPTSNTIAAPAPSPVHQDLGDIERTALVERFQRTNQNPEVARIDDERSPAAPADFARLADTGRIQAEQGRQVEYRATADDQPFKLDAKIQCVGIRENEDEHLQHDLGLADVERLNELAKLVEPARFPDGDERVGPLVRGQRQRHVLVHPSRLGPLETQQWLGLGHRRRRHLARRNNRLGTGLNSIHFKPAQRKSCKIPARYGFDLPDYVGLTVNMSRTGLFLGTSLPLKTGRPIRVDVSLGGEDAELRGVVMWNRRRDDSDRPAGMGIRLIEPPSSYPTFVYKLP